MKYKSSIDLGGENNEKDDSEYPLLSDEGPIVAHDQISDTFDQANTKKVGVGYRFREGELIRELKDYIESTYESHYATGKIQSTEVIIDRGHGMGFALGNVDKYNARYGKKGGRNRADLMKILHYGLIAIYVHDKEVDGHGNV